MKRAGGLLALVTLLGAALESLLEPHRTGAGS